MPDDHASDLARLGSRLSAIDPGSMTSSQRHALLVQLQSLQAQLAAVESEALVAECGAVPRTREVHLGATRDLIIDTRALERQHAGEVHVVTSKPGAEGSSGTSVVITDEAVDELAALLHRSTGSVRHSLRRARTLHRPLAEVRAALAAGTISVRHATAICDQANRMQAAALGEQPELDAEFERKCAALATAILPIAIQSTAGRTESQAQRLIAQIDAAAEQQRRLRAKRQIDVVARPGVDGLAGVYATMSAIDAARLMGRVDAVTSQSLAAGTPLLADPDATIGQQRVAALLHLAGLLVGPQVREASAAGNRRGHVEVQVLVDARVLAGMRPDDAGWVRTGSGFAPLSRDDIVELLADPHTPTVLRRLLVDPVSGVLADRGAATYAPSATLIAWLHARDQHCRFPGCTARAENCDVDHATDFASLGPTTRANTGLLCRRHHNLKTHGGWRIVDTRADGACTFISPSGMRYEHEPTNLASLMAGAPGRAAQAPAPKANPNAESDPDPPF